ncbi:amphi-Trp domain-containing protein [Natronorubrum thiooxidans]|uniref:Uncharacterized conserved protein YegP, UPF0339 family n=1 Tax=Natronorubrum thiooxidans TaxID=308853 RepID=A0A1N7G8A0_9EURY|nr:DUF1508 domain-containing protein [Natronorubrum thiooxidans]SIS08831.1 Uncharacterized conserved protein YegP, UPF0339 family [Natronorubrum thiooxidans]
MTDPSSDTDVTVAFERGYDRDELAAVFGELETALTADRPLWLTDGDRTVRVTIPSPVTAMAETRRDDDADPSIAELTLAFEWDDPDGSRLRLEDAERDAPGVASDEPPATDDAAADSRMATMPPDAIAGEDEPETAQADASGAESEAQPESESAADDRERHSRFEVYEDRAGEWRWRLVHWNGNIIADSGEGYASRSNARRAARGVMRNAPTATLEDAER